jgi:hypothetical protein
VPGGRSIINVNFLGALPLEIDIRTDVDEGTPTVAKDQTKHYNHPTALHQ